MQNINVLRLNTAVYIAGKRCTLENIESVDLTESSLINNTANEVMKSGPDIVPAQFVFHLMTGYIDGGLQEKLTEKGLGLFLYILLGMNVCGGEDQ